MFIKSSTVKPVDMFSHTTNLIPENIKKQYDDPLSWHNLFFKQITSCINEDVFKPLFNAKHGAPNFSIRVLVCMLILKEAEGLSDRALFEDITFNLLTRRSLGLENLSDAVPVESTYYLFRKRLVDYQSSTGIDLMQLMFRDITQKQCLEFGVKGKRIRMDSKLIGSNIAWLSRYELVHSFLVNFYKMAKHWGCFDESEMKQFRELKKSKGQTIVYHNTNADVVERLKALGSFISGVLGHCVSKSNTKLYQSLKRLFDEQYEVIELDKINVRDAKTIAADSIQSPYDMDATYRVKGDQKVKGNSYNICETNDDQAVVNLITDVQVEKATFSDNKYLIPAVAETELVTQQSVEDVHVDGCYQSESNKAYCEDNDINLHLTGLQGAEGRYALVVKAENELEVTDKKTGEVLPAVKKISGEGEVKWKVKLDENKVRYFTQKEVDSYVQREALKNAPQEILQKRNNVEATIFQMGYHYARGQTKYRGIERQNIWVKARCLWINFVRISKYLTQKLGNLKETAKNIGKTQVFTNLGVCLNLQFSKIVTTLRFFSQKANLQSIILNFFLINRKSNQS